MRTPPIRMRSSLLPLRLRLGLSRALLLGLLGTSAGATEVDPGAVVLEDTIAVQVLGRELVAFDLEGSGQLVERLEIDEQVLFTASRGRIAVALTDRRMLGATPRSSGWQSERYRVQEQAQHAARVSQTLALVVTGQRALAFFGTGNWAEQRLGPREALLTVRVGPAAAVVVTDRRALGISGETGGFFPAELRIGEAIESVSAVSSIATVTTSQRTLVFKGPSGLWTERDRTLR